MKKRHKPEEVVAKGREAEAERGKGGAGESPASGRLFYELLLS